MQPSPVSLVVTVHEAPMATVEFTAQLVLVMFGPYIDDTLELMPSAVNAAAAVPLFFTVQVAVMPSSLTSVTVNLLTTAALTTRVVLALKAMVPVFGVAFM